MNKNKKYLKSVIAVALITGTLTTPFVSASALETNNGVNSSLSSLEDNQQMFLDAFEKAILENQDEFNDPSIAPVLIQKLHQNQNIENNSNPMARGKVTMGAKAGAKALKAAMNKIGKSAWNKMIASIEKNMGTKLVVLHWEGMNKLINILSNSSTTITDALTNYLHKNAGFNKTFAEIVARTFVTIVL